MARVRYARSALDVRAVLRLYVERVPEVGFEDSCIFLPHPFARDVMGQRGEAKIWLTPSFRCYLFKFRFHE